MRSRFNQQLYVLHNNLIEMGALLEQAITKATKSLLEQDIELATEVKDSDNIIDDKEKEIERLCLKLLLSQQPVARDLRQISAALKMITDMERIGDQAAHISEICIYLASQHYIKELNHIYQMANEAIKIVTGSIDAYVRSNLILAQEVIRYDDIIDDLYDKIKKDLIILVHEDVRNGEQAFDLLQIAKYYERIGDHAVNIAEWVIFSITGQHNNK
ncbi:MAG: phosphate signaling complex protein PhoU [Erysipelotrichaceae bacterium]|nr:phosphate signaling complex protein PhoU [Erysipelotrichaceae bacterium]